MARYIDADIAEKSLRQYAEQKHANGEIELANGILKAVCKLRTLPSADVKEVVRGGWIEHINSYENYCECSRCGYIPDSPLDETNFCPNCGAGMGVE
ncbi:hypothetical protein [Anaerotignum sp. MB30-C6]|uniref:hypothetical protein n=1 Tax=Anaerotignum sp. MB30-C6 TaxID=3070814 RepID=UPI0027DCF5FB|nr:hypothetical protein [Anaerotignum sp. MB30-C6]WMI81922.1 hypothetical protein RBQ60_04110 [Anaerotignum sp. MB30-C6]